VLGLVAKVKTRFKAENGVAPSRVSSLFFCYLPSRIGFFACWLLKLFYHGIAVSTEQIEKLKTLPENAVVVYVNKSLSYFEYLFYHTRYGQENLKVPEIAFEYKIVAWQPVWRTFRILLSQGLYLLRKGRWRDPYQSGFILSELTRGRSAFLSLVGRKGFYRRFVKTKTDPLGYLLQVQAEIERPIYIVPQLMFFGRKPDKTRLSPIEIIFGTENQPGKALQEPGQGFRRGFRTVGPAPFPGAA
jgi:glycerol-3-phosphate O-acyltransferase